MYAAHGISTPPRAVEACAHQSHRRHSEYGQPLLNAGMQAAIPQAAECPMTLPRTALTSASTHSVHKQAGRWTGPAREQEAARMSGRKPQEWLRGSRASRRPFSYSWCSIQRQAAAHVLHAHERVGCTRLLALAEAGKAAVFKAAEATEGHTQAPVGARTCKNRSRKQHRAPQGQETMHPKAQR